jgi:release factor glutamine methyltransferase
VLDVGTGTGAIALAVKDEHPDARVTAVDTSREAVALARENAERLGLDVEVREGGLDVAAQGWDLVVANPPYVTPEEWDGLQPEIRDWEPREALVGVGLYADLARLARTSLLVLETHECQARDVAETLTSLGYTDVRITPDLAGKPRVVEGRR